MSQKMPPRKLVDKIDVITTLIAKISLIPVVLLAVYAAWLVFGYIFSMFVGCLTCMNTSEKIFLANLKSQIHEVDEKVKVSGIHSGNWLRVCAVSGGIDFDLKNVLAEYGQPTLVLNSSDTHINSSSDLSGLIFDYGVNEEGVVVMEVFKALPKMGYYTRGEHQCYDKADAFFQVVSTREDDNGVKLPHSFKLVGTPNVKKDTE